MIFIFVPHCSRPNGLKTTNMAPAYLHATSVALHPALFSKSLLINLFGTYPLHLSFVQAFTLMTIDGEEKLDYFYFKRLLLQFYFSDDECSLGNFVTGKLAFENQQS